MAVQYSIQKMVSDGTLSTIALGVQYLQRNDIYIRIAGEETPQSGASSGYTWSFVNNTTLKILPVVPNGVEVVVYRRTDVDAMYNIYSQNAQFDEATIDENNQQLLYIAQEYLEQGLPGAGVDTIEFLRDDGTNTYYRIKRTDGSYSAEFIVPSVGSNVSILIRAAIQRSYAEAGLNLVVGNFRVGFTLVNANDVALDEVSGKAYSGPAGTYPEDTSTAGFTDRSGELLRNLVIGEIAKPKYPNAARNYANANRGDTAAFRSILAWNATDIGEDKFSPTDTVYYRFPQILKLPSGALVLVTSTMHGSNSDPGQSAVGQYDLTVKWSFDGGTTWTNKKIIAQFGPTYQNVDACIFYDQSRDRIWCFFTSCKGVTGVNHSQAGTTDPDVSSQVYYTYSNGESNSWVTPVNVTADIKPATSQFFGISNGKGFAFVGGKLAIPMLTYNSGNQITTHYVEFDPDADEFKIFNINTGATGGEQTLTMLSDGTLLSTARGLPAAGKGQQLFFYSRDIGRTWLQDAGTVIQTTEVKGDIARIADYTSGRPTYVFAAANGTGNNQEDRANLRIWFSNDLKTWGLAPISVYASQVGYVACISGSAEDEILVASEVGGQSGIFFHSCSLRYVRSQTFSTGDKAVKSCNTANSGPLIASGAIKDHDFFFDSSVSALYFTNAGGKIPVALFDPVISITGSVNSPNVSGKSIVQIDASCVLQGFSGGYIGQRITVVSTGSANIGQLVRLSSGVPATERLFYDLSGSFTILHVAVNKQQSVDFVKTEYGWVSGTKANT